MYILNERRKTFKYIYRHPWDSTSITNNKNKKWFFENDTEAQKRSRSSHFKLRLLSLLTLHIRYKIFTIYYGQINLKHKLWRKKETITLPSNWLYNYFPLSFLLIKNMLEKRVSFFRQKKTHTRILRNIFQLIHILYNTWTFNRAPLTIYGIRKFKVKRKCNNEYNFYINTIQYLPLCLYFVCIYVLVLYIEIKLNCQYNCIVIGHTLSPGLCMCSYA